MTLKTVLPFGAKESVKNLIFTILTKEYPLKLIDLTNFIRKRYGRSVTFQAVRKATLQLVEEGVLIRDENGFSINKEWVAQAKQTLEKLHADLQEKKKPAQMDSIGGEVTVFTFASLAKMMRFWQDLADNWYRTAARHGQTNCWQGAHLWEALLYPDSEREIFGQMRAKGIKSYAICMNNTPLDRSTMKFYRSIGLKAENVPSNSSFDHAFYVATYGDLVVQTQYPPDLVKAIDGFFRKNKNIADLDVTELAKIANHKCEVKLTVIRNLAMAQQINKSIMDQMG